MHDALLIVNVTHVFRGGGFISLENLLFFARNFPVSLYFNYSCPNFLNSVIFNNNVLEQDAIYVCIL